LMILIIVATALLERALHFRTFTIKPMVLLFVMFTHNIDFFLIRARYRFGSLSTQIEPTMRVPKYSAF